MLSTYKLNIKLSNIPIVPVANIIYNMAAL